MLRRNLKLAMEHLRWSLSILYLLVTVIRSTFWTILKDYWSLDVKDNYYLKIDK